MPAKKKTAPIAAEPAFDPAVAVAEFTAIAKDAMAASVAAAEAADAADAFVAALNADAALADAAFVADAAAEAAAAPSTGTVDDWIDAPQQPPKAVHAAPLGHNVPVDDLDAIAEEIRETVALIDLNASGVRPAWMRIASLLLMARNVAPDNATFAAWIKASGIGKLDGLKTASARSDAIWCAEYPERVELVPERANSPRSIRGAWREEFISLCRSEAESLITLEATTPPDIDAAAEAVAVKLKADKAEAEAAIETAIEYEVSGTKAVEALAKAGKALAKALQNACDAGFGAGELTEMATHVWGGLFFHTHLQSALQLGIQNLILSGYDTGQISQITEETHGFLMANKKGVF